MMLSMLVLAATLQVADVPAPEAAPAPKVFRLSAPMQCKADIDISLLVMSYKDSGVPKEDQVAMINKIADEHSQPKGATDFTLKMIDVIYAVDPKTPEQRYEILTRVTDMCIHRLGLDKKPEDTTPKTPT